MPPLLEAAEFLPADLPLVADFSAGEDTEWGMAMTEWIKSPPTKRFGNAETDTVIWLYYHPDGRIVGFGSLGTTRRRCYQPDGPYENYSFIPALAIQRPFQHLPPDDLNNPPFSHQIMLDLIFKAFSQPPDVVLLLVHPENRHAAALYRRFEFEALPERHKNGDIMMQLRLR
jgi:ribosomal protein S18 acetylase RimI-like enzyme